MPKTVLFFLLYFSVACVHFVGMPMNNPKPDIHSLEIDTWIQYQEMDHFGASDAWSGQFVGNWPAQKKEAIADLLFSNAMDDQGNPIGTGLSLWRIILGAGSAEQGAKSGIKDPWRRAPSFLDKDGKFDKERQYLTDENHDLTYQEIPSAKSVRIPARSILTLTTQSL